ncbi:MAG TPA: alpha/beta hydrolase [Propionibacteriaceae bacterium]|nr:alpha/beta hydrolase [Propionibacteriaceae bacterium]
MTATGWLLRGLGRLTSVPVERQLADLATRNYPAYAALPRSMRSRYDVGETTIDGCPVLRLTPRSGASGQQLIYAHGGWYVRPLVAAHWWLIDRSTRGTGVTITLPFYRLAPEGGVERGYAMFGRVYAELTASGSGDHVTLAGDSAGGGLALGQAIDYRNAGAPAPRQVILLSPWVDITMANPEIASLQSRDPMLHTAEPVAFGPLWAGGLDHRHSRLSPLSADLTGLPPVHIFQGGRDILAADAQLLARRLHQAGNAGTLTFVPGAFHNYLAAFWTPEARAALGAVRSLLRPPS